MKYPGIPDKITLDFVRKWVEPRISPKRFKHIEGVVAVAEELAESNGSDVFLAQLGGWLHDACKEVKDKQLVELAGNFGIALDPILERYGYLLHGPVAAETARRDLGIKHQELLDAIAEHTLGAAPMSDLSKILFLADCLEESRPKDYTKPIWKALGRGGKLDMDAAIVVASDLNLKFLIDDGKPIHPRTIEVRNYYLSEVASRSRAHST
jgi:predicted HD superfamily hydrolase involved in NAD metabolism